MSDLKLYFEPISRKTAQSDPKKYAVLRKLRAVLSEAYSAVHRPDEANVVVAIGGDGQMLSALRRAARFGAKVFGIHAGDGGSKGALLNHYFNDFDEIRSVNSFGDLPKDLQNLNALLALATAIEFVPLHVAGKTTKGKDFSAVGFNDVAVEHRIGQDARLRVIVNHKQETLLKGNGIVIATAPGSSAYVDNNSGIQLPFKSKLLSVTSLSSHSLYKKLNEVYGPFNAGTHFEIQNLEPIKRKVDMAVDNQVFRDVKECVITQADDQKVPVLYDSFKIREIRARDEQVILRNKELFVGRTLVCREYL